MANYIGIIEEMREFIEDCKRATFSSTRITVDKEELLRYLDLLEKNTPEEIKGYKRTLSNKDAIIAKAQDKAKKILENSRNDAKRMLDEVQIQTSELINEHEIMQRAIEQANEMLSAANDKAQEIVDEATESAAEIQMNAIEYTDDMLANLQLIIENSIDDYKAKTSSLMDSFSKNLKIIQTNREELKPKTEEEVAITEELAANVKEVIEEEEE